MKLPSRPVKISSMVMLAAGLAASPMLSVASGPSHHDPRAAEYRAWIGNMKTSPRGPFERIRWFCKDGTVLPPKAYACANHGGGIQHGQWNESVVTIRDAGYLVANVLADIDPGDYIGASPDLDALSQILLERFLIGADDNWIFRGAYSYRGALQAEDEEAGSLALVRTMLAEDDWRRPERFLLLRETVRLLPIQTDENSASNVRQLALDIAEKDSGFTELRIKIHGAPEGADAGSVRRYAKASGKTELRADYERIAAMIDDLYAPRGAVDALGKLAERAEQDDVAKLIRDRAMQMASALTPPERLRVAGYGMLAMRDKFQSGTTAEDGLTILLASIALESVAYTAGNELAASLGSASRKEQLVWLGRGVAAIYGTGFLSKRQLMGAARTIKTLFDEARLDLDQYSREVRYLARIPEWASGTLSFNFSEAMGRFMQIEPLAHIYIQDRLRGSPMLICGAIVDSLGKDANRVAGIEHSLFGRKIGAGLRALNPGLLRGVLYAPGADADLSRTDEDGIYLLPETISELPKVGGILTQGEGSSLSHVQLLARNLGIPNVVVGNEVLGDVRRHVGKRIVMAVSPGGVVQLAEDGPKWDEIFGKQEQVDDVVIAPDLEKLDIKTTDLISLRTLRATDSGRTSGPKGANLGELKHHFGDAVPGGFVIPFGAFRAQLEKPLEPGGPKVYDWMKRQYDEIATLGGDPQRRTEVVSSFLSRLRKWIVNTDQGPEFRARLRAALDSEFGAKAGYGAFVRSDTNVEDLPGFTGAGLNKTIPNVVGFEEVVRAVREVWASPFTERAYGWRQSHMKDPEFVFPAVVVQYSFPAEKSGVMVTTDLEGRGDGWLSIAVSEGVGGAVDGQAAEQLRVDRKTREVIYLAQASAPYKNILNPAGGVKRVRASGTDRLLSDEEIEQLIAFAAKAPSQFPSLRTADGGTLPADVEFAFRNGRLALLQLRPFVESKSAQRNEYLNRLDAGFAGRGGVGVALEDTPGR